MQLKALLVLLVVCVAVTAQDIDDNDVPNQCRSVCQPVTLLTQQCDAQNDDDSNGYINCVCNFPDASNLVPICEACVASLEDHDNDVNDIVRSCSFSTGSYTSGQSVATSMTRSPANSAVPTTIVGTNAASTEGVRSSIAGVNSAASSAFNSATSVIGGAVSSATSSVLQQSTNAAAATTIPMLGAGAGLALVALGM
ncbi:hypothetical protein LTS18_014184 [Coniosporium uncinatum]|uniref:Uncharacterized protein n=1 Tax=Coniosporium uncinatum TaxID=93489 RepID=A0ACC3DD93_9PEZI|nr:hypothetical protein LTS18_014184 [Coniosporium uncinatum]